uniref:Uncharacterized protein n=1 Tax=Anopheles darlingi TaxID=43151 RepID=A0A2M4DII8_ANODA
MTFLSVVFINLTIAFPFATMVLPQNTPGSISCANTTESSFICNVLIFLITSLLIGNMKVSPPLSSIGCDIVCPSKVK